MAEIELERPTKDANFDGSISEDEMAAALKARSGLGLQGSVPSHRGLSLFARAFS